MGHRLLVGTEKGLYEVDSGQRILFPGREVSFVTKDKSGWWAIVDSREVWHWKGQGPWDRFVSTRGEQANCLLWCGGSLLIGTAEAHLLRLRGGALQRVKSFDTAPGREHWYTPWGGPADVRSMTVDASGNLYVNVHVGGIVRSIDKGKTWQPTIDIHTDVHQVLVDSASGLVLAASAQGLAVSGDGGTSWQCITKGLLGSYSRAVAVAGDAILLGVSRDFPGHEPTRAAVYRKPLTGRQPFERCRAGLPEWFSNHIDTYCLTASGPNVALGTSEGAVFFSDDAGMAWTVVAEELPLVQAIALG